MKNVLILHGSSNNSEGNWIPWMKKNLEEKGWKVWTPNLPNSEYPDMEEWVNFIFSNKKWKFNKESIIIGHSSGATLVLGLLQKLPSDIKVNMAILVAGFVQFSGLPEVDEVIKGQLKEPFNWKKIKKASKDFFFIHSDNDQYRCGVEQGKIMQKNLGGKLIIKKGEGHFNLTTNKKYKTFPFLLRLLNKF